MEIKGKVLTLFPVKEGDVYKRQKLYLCRKWMQKRLQKTTTTGITLPNFDFLA